MPRFLALDVGDSTVGVAVSDALGVTAQGITTIRRGAWKNDVAQLKAIMEQYETESLIVGLPRNMNGTEGARCEVVRTFAADLTAALPTAQITFWDERLSTVTAENVLKDAGMNWRKRRKVVDKMAATVILQSFLDAHAAGHLTNDNGNAEGR